MTTARAQTDLPLRLLSFLKKKKKNVLSSVKVEAHLDFFHIKAEPTKPPCVRPYFPAKEKNMSTDLTHQGINYLPSYLPLFFFFKSI